MRKLIWILVGLNIIVLVGGQLVLKCFEYQWFQDWLVSQKRLVDLLI